MPGKRNCHPFTKEGVLAYMTDKRGTRYQCSYLARIFKVTTKMMRPHLDALDAEGSIRSVVEGTYRWFYIPSLEELILAERLKTIKERQQTELKGYDTKLNQFRELCMMVRR